MLAWYRLSIWHRGIGGDSLNGKGAVLAEAAWCPPAIYTSSGSLPSSADGHDAKHRIESVPTDVVDDLRNRGHQVVVHPHPGYFGRGQIILRSPDGMLFGGSESRADGYAVGY